MKRLIIFFTFVAFVATGCDIANVVTEPTRYASIVVVNEDTKTPGTIYNMGEATRHTVGAPGSNRFNARITVSDRGRMRTTIHLFNESANKQSDIAKVSFRQDRGIVPTVIFREGWGRTRVMAKASVSAPQSHDVVVRYSDPNTGEYIEVSPTRENGKLIFDID